MRAVTLQLALPEDDSLLSVVTIRQRADGEYTAELHTTNALSRTTEPLPPRALANLLRWLAERIDMEAL
jgi:hypothetical protein